MSVDRDTFKHAAVYSGAAMLGRMIGFLLLPFYTHVLGDIGYGVIGMVESALGLLMSLLAQGIRGALIRIYHDQPDEAAQNRVVSTGTWLIVGVTLAMTLIGMAVSRPVSALLLDSGDSWYLLCLGLAAFFFDLVGNTAGTVLIIRRKSVKFSVISLIRLAVGLGLNIYLILVLGWGLLGYFLSSLAVALLTSVVYWLILKKDCGLEFDRDIARQLVAFQLPLIPGSLASFASRQAERVLLRFINNLGSVGVLEIGYKFPVLLTLLIHQPFMRSWDTGRVQIAEEPDGPERIGRMFTYALFLITAAGLMMAVCIEDVLRILTPPEFWIAHRIAKIEIVSTILMSCVYHLNFGIFYCKETKEWGKLRGWTSALKLVLSVGFIWAWGLDGAAFSALVTALVVLIWGGAVGQRLYRIGVETAKVWVMVGLAVVIFAVLDRIDLADAAWLTPVREVWMPRCVDVVQGSFLGTWKNGKAVVLLSERSDLIVDAAVKFLMSCVFLLYLPAAHDPTRKRIVGRFRRS